MGNSSNLSIFSALIFKSTLRVRVFVFESVGRSGEEEDGESVPLPLLVT